MARSVQGQQAGAGGEVQRLLSGVEIGILEELAGDAVMQRSLVTSGAAGAAR